MELMHPNSEGTTWTLLEKVEGKIQEVQKQELFI